MAADGGSTTLTATGQLIGTPFYMPLEQLRGGEATPHSDQFALCVCLWEALVGSRPFRPGGSIAAIVVAMREPPRLPLRQRGVLAVLARGLDPDPARRWPDVPALLAALDRARRWRWWWLAALTLALALALAALAR